MIEVHWNKVQEESEKKSINMINQAKAKEYQKVCIFNYFYYIIYYIAIICYIYIYIYYIYIYIYIYI